jgi:hypothetical protein
MGGLMTKPTPPYNDPVSIGIDFNKRYSVFCVLDAKGGITDIEDIEANLQAQSPPETMLEGKIPSYDDFLEHRRRAHGPQDHGMV